MRLSGWVCDFSLGFWQGVLYGSETQSVAHALSDEDTRGNRLTFTFLVPVSIAHSLCVADVQFNGSLHTTLTGILISSSHLHVPLHRCQARVRHLTDS
jgi:hypothetical protein